MQGNPTIQRNLLPVGDHRNWVKAAARHLRDPFTASDNLWIQAIYRALDGVGNPAADKCCEKLIEQRIIDVNDWQILVKDYQLYRSGKGEGFDLHDRHNVPRVHNEEEAGKWVATLITNRIGDLYTTVPGFVGHANQVQLGITQLVSWYQAKLFDEGAYSKFKAEIIKALRVGKAKSALVIPKYVYVFENGSSTAIE